MKKCRHSNFAFNGSYWHCLNCGEILPHKKREASRAVRSLPLKIVT